MKFSGWYIEAKIEFMAWEYFYFIQFDTSTLKKTIQRLIINTAVDHMHILGRNFIISSRGKSFSLTHHRSSL